MEPKKVTVEPILVKSRPQKGANNRHTTIDKKIYATFCDKMWTIYPDRKGKKLGKKNFYDKFIKHVKLNEFDNFEKALLQYKKHCQDSNAYPVDAERFVLKNNNHTWKEWIEIESSSNYSKSWDNNLHTYKRKQSSEIPEYVDIIGIPVDQTLKELRSGKYPMDQYRNIMYAKVMRELKAQSFNKSSCEMALKIIEERGK